MTKVLLRSGFQSVERCISVANSFEHVRRLGRIFGGFVYMEHNNYILNGWQTVKFQLVTNILSVLMTLSFNVLYQSVQVETIYLEGVGEKKSVFKISA